MLINRFRVLFIISILIGLACTTAAQCRTEESAPCKQYEGADAIFIGAVKAIHYSEPIYESRRWQREKTTLFEVKEHFKGIGEKQTEIAITTFEYLRESRTEKTTFEKQPNQGCVFYEFNEGESYLVYASKAGQEKKDGFVVWFGQAIPSAEADGAVKYLRNRQAGHHSATLYGRVVRKMRPLGDDLGNMPKRPFRNIQVELQSATQRFVTTTDEKGYYLFSDIPPGQYSINCDLPVRLEVEMDARKLTLSAQSCKEHNIEALTTGQISGTVLNHEGKPKFAEVELVVAEEANSPKPRRFVVSAGWQSGKFEFKHIPPAQYFLGVNLSKLCRPGYHGEDFSCRPRTYYPGVSDLAQATLITLTEGEQLKDFDFRLSAPFSTRTISGFASLPDGKPAASAEISLMIVQGESVEVGGFTKTDEYGRFSISAYNDLKSWISANVKVKGKDWHSEPVDLSTGNEVNEIKLVLSSSGKFCPLCYNKFWKRKGTPPQ